jgi:hypothetical protein
VATVDLSSGALIDLTERHGVHPPIAPEEIQAATALASRDSRLAPLLPRAAMNLSALPTPGFSPDHPRAGHRLVTLYLQPELGRGERTEVTVDLSAQDIVPAQELLTGLPRLAQLPQAGDTTPQADTALPRTRILDQ